jgi:hypothetical protein
MTISATQVAQMKATHVSLMGDTCQIGTYASTTSDAHGQPTETWTYATAISCGVDISKTIRQQQAQGADMSLAFIDGRVRLPLGTTLNRRDRIKVTKMAGTTLTTALVFEGVGEPRPSHTALMVDVRWAEL